MKHWKTVIKAACLSLALSSTSALAEFKAVAHIGYESGGDVLLDVDFSDGSSSSINAGDGLVFAAGAAYFLKPELAIQGTLGWKYQTIQQNTDGDAYLNRFPLEATVQYSPSNFRIGAGITYHLNPKLHASGVLAPAETSFDNALGTIYNLDYITEAGLIWGIRYTNLNYTVSNTNYDVDAGSLGIHLTGQF